MRKPRLPSSSIRFWLFWTARTPRSVLPLWRVPASRAKVVKNGKGKKIDIIRYKSKKNEKKHIGHRQPYTKVEITKIAL